MTTEEALTQYWSHFARWNTGINGNATQWNAVDKKIREAQDALGYNPKYLPPEDEERKRYTKKMPEIWI